MVDLEQLRVLRRPGPAVTTLLAVAVVAVSVIEMSSSLRPFGFSLAAALTNGMQTGGVYALIALGVAIVYRSTRVINFAQGELGTIPAFLVMSILIVVQPGIGFDQELNSSTVNKGWFIGAVLIAVVFGAILAMAINLLVVQRLAEASPVTSLVSTAGITVLFASLEVLVFDARVRTFPRLIEGAPGGFSIGPLCLSQRTTDGVCDTSQSLAIVNEVVPWNTILIFALLIIVSVTLAAFFRSPPGVALLAAAQEPLAAELYGVSPRAMSTLAWGFAGAFGALAGVLGAGVFSQIRPGLMTSDFLVPGLVAAVLGGITSMPGAVAGGLIVGLLASLANAAVLELDWTVPNPPQVAIFVALLLVLLFRPRGLLGKDA